MTSQIAAQWVSAVGSAGSLLGFAAYVWIMLLNRKDQVEVRQEQQAQGVTAWLDEGASARPRRGLRPHACTTGATRPVFQVRCLFSLPSSDEQHSVSMALLPPASDEIHSLPFGVRARSDREELYSAPAVPEMRFTDSHGTHWGRDSNGDAAPPRPPRTCAASRQLGRRRGRAPATTPSGSRRTASGPTRRAQGSSQGDSPQDDRAGQPVLEAP